MPDTILRPLLDPIASTSGDFDFLMGIWRCHHRYRVKRLARCNDWIEFDGTCAARRILGGLGNTDESDIAMPGGRYTGMSLDVGVQSEHPGRQGGEISRKTKK